MFSDLDKDGQLTQKLPIKRQGKKRRVSKRSEQPRLTKSKSKSINLSKSRGRSSKSRDVLCNRIAQKKLLFEDKGAVQIDKMLLSDVDIKRSGSLLFILLLRGEN